MTGPILLKNFSFLITKTILEVNDIASASKAGILLSRGSIMVGPIVWLVYSAKVHTAYKEVFGAEDFCNLKYDFDFWVLIYIQKKKIPNQINNLFIQIIVYFLAF